MPDSINNERFRKLLQAVPGKAIEYLFATYYDSLLRISLRYTRDREASADVVQEVFIHVWEKNRSLSRHHKHPIEAYLVRVVKNRSISHFKSMALHGKRVTTLNGSSIPGIEKSGEAQLIQEEISQELKKSVSNFPKREKQCLLMRYEDEMSIAEIAKDLGVSEKAVERSITSGNKRLRRYWEKMSE